MNAIFPRGTTRENGFKAMPDEKQNAISLGERLKGDAGAHAHSTETPLNPPKEYLSIAAVDTAIEEQEIPLGIIRGCPSLFGAI